MYRVKACRFMVLLRHRHVNTVHFKTPKMLLLYSITGCFSWRELHLFASCVGQCSNIIKKRTWPWFCCPSEIWWCSGNIWVSCKLVYEMEKYRVLDLSEAFFMVEAASFELWSYFRRDAQILLVWLLLVLLGWVRRKKRYTVLGEAAAPGRHKGDKADHTYLFRY